MKSCVWDAADEFACVEAPSNQQPRSNTETLHGILSPESPNALLIRGERIQKKQLRDRSVITEGVVR